MKNFLFFNKRPYSGLLKKHIALSQHKQQSSIRNFFSLTDNENETNQFPLLFLFEERLKKIPLLYQHFNLNPNNPADKNALILALAERHVEGFKPANPLKKRGSPRRWGPLKLFDLYMAVNDLQKEKTHYKVTDACRYLIKHDERWKSKRSRQNLGSKQSIKLLQDKYTESKNSDFVKLYHASQHSEETKDLFEKIIFSMKNNPEN